MTEHSTLFYIVDWLPPDFGAVGQYGMVFARELAEAGRPVILIGLTTGPAGVAHQKFPGSGSLEIHRITAPAYNKARNIERLIWTARVNYRLIRAMLRHPASPRADVLFTGAPPFMLYFAVALKLFRKVYLTYRITDFYPEVIIAERGHSPLVLRLLQRMTWFMRRRVDHFEALGEDQRQLLIRGGIPASRISIKRDRSPVSFNEDEQPYPAPAETKGRKILLYSGNCGVAHDVDTVVEGLTLHHRFSNRFAFWLNAVGRNVDVIASKLSDANVPFVRSTPVALDRLPSLLAAADVHLITLRPQFSGIVLPSKIYACIASGRPILFVGPASSDIHLLCCEAAGLAYERVEPGDAEGFAKALDRLTSIPKQVHTARTQSLNDHRPQSMVSKNV
jgi:hypothetical protein